MSKYYKIKWKESLGDEFDDWGASEWFIEIGEDRFPVRQLAIFENGNVLKYDSDNTDDQFGMLGDQPLEVKEHLDSEITRADFENSWINAIARISRDK